jgi:geranylgeranyl diphosphate synthase type I
MDIKAFKVDFVTHVETFLETQLASYNEYTQDEFLLSLIHHVKDVAAGGKCVRPYMAAVMYKGLSGEEEIPYEVMNILVAIELLHTFALVHDDVIDEAGTRHQTETIHRYATRKMQEEGRSGKLEHIGEAQAILVGNLLYTWVNNLFARAVSTHEHGFAAWQAFHKMADEVIVGQMIDVDLMTRSSSNWDLIESKMRLKTAGYTFVRPMQIGSALAGKYEEYEEFCLKFGRTLGVGFQVQDDLLDLLADPETLKKPVLLDIKEHQHTYLTQYIVENGSEQEREKLYSYWGKNFDASSRDEIIELFTSSGAVDYSLAKAQEYFKQARDAVEEAILDPTTKDILGGLVTYIEHRSY